jgi:anti-sigma factor RsiW
VKCQEYYELISAEVDGELETGKKELLHKHLQQCRHCCNALELEKITKLYIGGKLSRARAPEKLKTGILHQLRPEMVNPRLTFLQNIFRIPNWQIVTAFAGSTAVIVIVLLLQPWRADRPKNPPQNNNIIHRTFNNYHGILQGELIPAVVTDNNAVADLYFRYDNQFQAYVPRMAGFRLTGAAYNKYTHEGMAHLVYRQGDQIIYILEADLNELMDKDGLAIPADVFAEVMKGDIYSERRIEDYSLVMWIHDATLCCAMTNISNQQLISCLTNE